MIGSVLRLALMTAVIVAFWVGRTVYIKMWDFVR